MFCGRWKALGYMAALVGIGILLALIMPVWVLVFLLALLFICVGFCLIRW